MLPAGQPTGPESFQIAELTLTTEFFWLAPRMLIGKLKTLGHQAGEKAVLSELLEETHARYAHTPLTQLFEISDFKSSYRILLLFRLFTMVKPVLEIEGKR